MLIKNIKKRISLKKRLNTLSDQNELLVELMFAMATDADASEAHNREFDRLVKKFQENTSEIRKIDYEIYNSYRK